METVCSVAAPVLPRLLIVGGTGRNVGKTACVCEIIRKISPRFEVFALKVSAVFPDEKKFHGAHDRAQATSGLTEEICRDGGKDTMRMLQSGAKRVFYLCSDGRSIADGFRDFLQKVPAAAAIVCESNSLYEVVRPNLLLVVKGTTGPVKPRAIPQLERADMVIVSDGKSGFPELTRLDFDVVKGWYFI
ncbi:MAG: hypothetical protein ACK5PS_05680 [Desulfopila sp.]